MANWSNPLLTSTYTNFLTEVKDRDTDLALQFDGTTSSNIPTNAIRWNSSVNRWQKWNGSAWGELTSTYALTGLSTTGNASIGGTLGSGAISSTGSVSGTALIPTGSTVPATGVYLPSTNTIGLSTSSTGRVFIDASGEFGVGTATPGTSVDVTLAAANATIGNVRIAPSSAGQARYHLYNGGGQAEWLFGQKTNTDHSFKLSKSVAGSETDFLTVDTGGRVGVGNIDPGYALDISSADGTAGIGYALRIRANTTAGAGAIQFTNNPVSTQYGFIVCDTSSNLRFAAGNNEVARFTSSGRLGLGTTSPSVLLHGLQTSAGASVIGASFVNNSSTASTGVSLDLSPANAAPGIRSAQIEAVNNGSNQISLNFRTSNAAAPDIRLTLDHQGRIGVNNTAPATILQVNGNPPSAESGNIYIANSGQARYRLYNGGGQAEWLFGQKTGTDHAFKLSKMVAGIESDYLTITTAGLVGVGITNPSQPLDVSGGIRSVSGSNEIFLNGGEAAVELSRSDSAAYIDFKTSAAEDFDCRIQQASNGLAFQTGGNGATAERLRIDSSGRVGIGFTSPAFPLDVNGRIRGIGPDSALIASNGSGTGQTSIALIREGAATDQKKWELFTGSGGEFKIRTINDGYTASQDAIVVNRGSGPAVDNVQLHANGSERLRITSSGFLGHNTTNPAAPVHFALPTTSATIGNVYVAPSTAGQARFHLYNGGSTAEWLFGQRTSTDHEFRFSTQVAGSETERLRIGTAGQIGIAGANYGTSGQVLTSNGSGSAPSWQSSFKTVAWVNFDGTGTVAIRASGNVSSITDNNIGRYTVNFTSAISDANYAALTSASDVVAARPAAFAAGTVDVYTYDTSNFVDSAVVSVAIIR